MEHRRAVATARSVRGVRDRAAGSTSHVTAQNAAAEGIGRVAVGLLFAVSAPAFIAIAYAGTGSLPFLLSGVVLLAAFLPALTPRRLHALDWAMLLVLVYEVPALLLSRYPANSLRATVTLWAAVSFYAFVRMLIRTPRQATVIAALVGTGGVVLAGVALMQFDRQVGLLRANGFSDVVAFRARLISPSAPWVLGEWFTLLLLTLPFACALVAYFWLEQRWLLAAGAALMPISITAGLLLSCSRAIFWALVAFVVVAVGIAAAYRVIRIKQAVVAIASTLCVSGVVLAAENVLCPGLVEAYAGQHMSQVRSTEGRRAIWKRSADVFKVSPLWGVGSGNAPLFLTSSADQDETTGFASRTFSLPIQVLAEKGAIGAALYLLVLVLAGWEAHRKLRSPKVSPQMKGLTCCLAAGVIAVLFRELTYSSLLEHTATAMLFAMAIALATVEEPA